jgi:predicted DNA-binding ribbon-helix-helix protein
MCEFFVQADPILYESRTRTVRIHGVLTSIRLENLVWDTLARMAADEGKSTNALIVTFYDEIMAFRGEVPNFASFLRVTCMRYVLRELSHQRAAVPPGPASAAVAVAAPPSAVVHALPTHAERPAKLARSA